MKALKILAFIIGGAVVLLAALLILAFTPAVQTWAIRKAVAGQPGITIEIGRAAIGLSAVDVTDLRVVKDRMVITAKGVSAKYSPWDYVAKKRLNADQVTVVDLLVDLRNASAASPAGVTGARGAASGASATAVNPAQTPGAPASGAWTRTPAAAPAPFDGVLKLAQLPLDLRLAQFAATGRVLLPGEQVATLDLKGAGLETGQRGKLDWTIAFTDSQKGAPLETLRTTGSATIHIAADRRVDLVDLETTTTATGPKLPTDQLKLEAKAEQPAAGGNETYTVRLGLLRGGAMEPVLNGSAQFAPATQEITGTWELSLRSEQLAATLAGLGLPDVAAQGSGKFTFQSRTNALGAEGSLQGQVSHLEKFSPALAAVGAVQFATSFDGGLAGDLAHLEQFALTLTDADGRKLAEISTLQKIAFGLAEQRVTLADPKAQLARISLQALPLAWAQSIAKPLTIDSGDLSLALTLEADADGSHVRVRSVDPIALRSVTLRNGSQKLVERATLTVRPEIDYAANHIAAQLTELSLSLPAGDSLSGRIAIDVTNFSTQPTVVFSTQLQGKAVGALQPYLPIDPGPLAIVLGVEGQRRGDSLRLGKASLTANRADGTLLAAVDLQQPIAADLKTHAFSSDQPATTTARLRLGEVPLAWAEKFVPNSKFAGTFAGGTFDVSFRSVDDVTLNTVGPVTLRGVGASLDGRPMVQGLDLTADLTAHKRAAAIGYEVRRIEVKQGNVSLAAFSATGEAGLGGKLHLTAKGNLDADAAALMNQPALAPFATLSRGKITTAFDATLADTIQIKATGSGRTLVARQNSQPLGDLEFSVTANVKADGSGTVSLPLTLTNGGRKSDVTIDGTFGRSATGFSFSGKIASTQLTVDDFQPLAALAPASAPPSTAAPATPAVPPPPAASRPSRDAQPFWQGAGGKIEVDLKKVTYGRDYTVNGIRGTVTVTGARLGLDGLEGKYKDNAFKLVAGIAFNAQQPKPYALTGSVDIANLDVGAFLRAANPNEKPAFETKVTVAAKLNGNGATLADLAPGVYGQFDVTGSKGVLRALGRKGETVSTVSSIVGLLGAARGSDTTVAVSELGRELNEMQFDQFKMRVERGADLNLKLTTIDFTSASTRVSGTGHITNQPGVPIQDQPLEIQMTLAGKEHMSQLLNRIGALSGSQDDKGYSPMKTPFVIRGTLANANSNDLWKTLGEMAARAAIGSFLK